MTVIIALSIAAGIALGLSASNFLALTLATVIVSMAGGLTIGANLPEKLRRRLIINVGGKKKLAIGKEKAI